MALRYLYSNLQVTFPTPAMRMDAEAALKAAFPELPQDRNWYHWYFTEDHSGVGLNVGGFNPSQIGDLRQRAFEVLRKLVPGFNPKEVRHETGEIIVPGRY